METDGRGLISPTQEVSVVEGELVAQIRELAGRGVGIRAIADAVGLARNTVRRYLRASVAPGVQTRPGARRLSEADREKARTLYAGIAEGNAVVVQGLLQKDGVRASIRTVERAVADLRRTARASALATVRVESPPGDQLQIDFGQKRVSIAGTAVRVFFLVAVLSYSRRLFVRAFLSERQDDWREGIAAAFTHFGGVTRTLLGDNARALVLTRDRTTGTVVFHPAYLGFCRDWDVQPRACAPYRARTKGKTEAGVKYVKRNAVAGRTFGSLAELEAHLASWMTEADARIHGTTHETPSARFDREERAALRPLPHRPLPRREQRLTRRVAHDAFVDIDTVRYSVPHRLVRDHVEVVIAEEVVRILHGGVLVATHRRTAEPHARVVDPAHYVGLWRMPAADEPPAPTLAPLGRDLADYAAVVAGGGR